MDYGDLGAMSYTTRHGRLLPIVGAFAHRHDGAHGHPRLWDGLSLHLLQSFVKLVRVPQHRAMKYGGCSQLFGSWVTVS